MPADVGHGTRRIVHVLGELAIRETPQHGGRSIMAGDAMKAKHPAHEPESAGGEPAPPQVAHDHCAPRNAIELSQDGAELRVLEVVQHLRADDDVGARIGKGKRSRVRT